MNDVKDPKWEEKYDEETERHTRFHKPMDQREYRLYMHEWVIKNTKEGDHVLDVGCADGELCYLLKEHGRNPSGIDVSPKAVELAKGYVPGVPFQQGYAEQLPFQEDLFYVVSSNQVLEHLKDPYAVIKEMLRVLKPDGS